MLGLCLGSSVLSGAHQGLHIVGDLIGHAAAVIVHGVSHSCSRFRRRSRGCGCDGSNGLGSGGCGLNALQSLNAGAHLLLNFGNFGVGGQTGLLHPGVLCCDQRLGIAARCGRGSGDSGSGDGLCLGSGLLQHPVALGLGLQKHLVGSRLGVAGGSLGLHAALAVLFQLAGQDTHLALEQCIFLIQRNIILGQGLQEFIHLLHIVAAEGCLGKRHLIDLLRSDHIYLLLPMICK